MAITYRNAGAWGAGKGARLTSTEVDLNFWDISGRLLLVETNPPDANGIASISVLSGQMRVTMDDATIFGPFTLPIASFRVRDEWLPSTSYIVNDLVSYETLGLYLVIKTHTSPTVFDAAHLDGGDLVYDHIFPSFAKPSPSPLVTVSASSRTLIASDSNSFLRCTHASGCAITVPNDATLDLADNTEIHFRQAAAAPVTFDGMVSVVINGIDGLINETETRGAVVTLKKVGANTWDLFGRLAAETTA